MITSDTHDIGRNDLRAAMRLLERFAQHATYEDLDQIQLVIGHARRLLRKKEGWMRRRTMKSITAASAAERIT